MGLFFYSFDRVVLVLVCWAYMQLFICSGPRYCFEYAHVSIPLTLFFFFLRCCCPLQELKYICEITCTEDGNAVNSHTPFHIGVLCLTIRTGQLVNQTPFENDDRRAVEIGCSGNQDSTVHSAAPSSSSEKSSINPDRRWLSTRATVPCALNCLKAGLAVDAILHNHPIPKEHCMAARNVLKMDNPGDIKPHPAHSEETRSRNKSKSNRKSKKKSKVRVVTVHPVLEHYKDEIRTIANSLKSDRTHSNSYGDMTPGAKPTKIGGSALSNDMMEFVSRGGMIIVHSSHTDKVPEPLAVVLPEDIHDRWTEAIRGQTGRGKKSIVSGNITNTGTGTGTGTDPMMNRPTSVILGGAPVPVISIDDKDEYVKKMITTVGKNNKNHILLMGPTENSLPGLVVLESEVSVLQGGVLPGASVNLGHQQIVAVTLGGSNGEARTKTCGFFHVLVAQLIQLER